MAVRAADRLTPPGDTFNPFRVGLDHLALGCRGQAELARVAAALTAAGVENTGVKLDPTLHRQYVAFKDPDRIAWEFYMAPESARDAVLSYFDGLRTGQLERIAFAPDVQFESPLTPVVRGAGQVREFLREVLPAIRGIEVQQVIVEGEYVGVRFTLNTVSGLVPAFDFFRVLNGEIVEARPYYDPRPLIGPAAQA